MASKEKKTKKPVKKTPKRRSSYFKGVLAELKKVNWPNRKELLTYSYVVVGAILASALLIYFADTIIAAILRLLT